MPRVSLVVTTYNRARLLARALASVAQTPAFSPTAELLVVDNNSSDETRRVFDHFARQNPQIEARYVFEVRQGLSHARNRGTQEARGQYVVFMDDDQEIGDEYVHKVESAFLETGAVCIGGKIVYKNADRLPAWLKAMVKTVGQLDLGNEVMFLDGKTRFLKGGNIAFERRTLVDIGGFNVALGRIGDSLGAAEEDEIQRRLVLDGELVAYVPELVQFNWILPEKFEKSYWRRQAYWYGKTQFALSSSEWAHANQVFGVPGSVIRSLCFMVQRYLAACLGRESGQRFERERDLLESLGVLVAAIEHRKHKK